MARPLVRLKPKHQVSLDSGKTWLDVPSLEILAWARREYIRETRKAALAMDGVRQSQFAGLSEPLLVERDQTDAQAKTE